MEQRLPGARRLELGGGLVTGETSAIRLLLPSGVHEYADAQIDDYGLAHSHREYAWLPGVRLSLNARFSHPQEELVGTAGFGFWNAPFGDPSIHYPALPQATWFFFASPPSDLPLPAEGPGQGWFASTIDAALSHTWPLLPLALPVVLLNQSTALRRRIWPGIREHLSISFAPITAEITDWHAYRLEWSSDNCRFFVDGTCILDTSHSPTGPLGFVCWMDNQYLVATPRGRFSWGTLPTRHEQWLEIADLSIDRL